MAVKETLEILYAYIRAIPALFVAIVCSVLYRISPKLLDAVAGYLMSRRNLTAVAKPSESINFMGTTKIYTSKVRNILADMRKTAQYGKSAPNPRLFDLKLKRWTHLLNYGGRSSRPLAVIFGSCT